MTTRTKIIEQLGAIKGNAGLLSILANHPSPNKTLINKAISCIIHAEEEATKLLFEMENTEIKTLPLS